MRRSARRTAASPFMINEDLHQVLAGRVPLAERHRRGPATAQRDRRHVEDRQAIDIHTFEASYNIIGKYPEAWAPKTRETADHSLPYCTAVALLDGDVTLAQFDPERFTEPDVLEAADAR